MVYLESESLRNADVLHEPIKTLCATVGLNGVIRLVQEFSDGFSDTRVVLAEHRSGPNDLQPFHFVFKVGSARSLRDEVRRYLDLQPYTRASAAFVPIWKADVTLNALPEDNSSAAIAYAHAADVFGAKECISFKSLFRKCIRGESPMAVGSTAIDSLGRVLGSLYAQPTTLFAHETALYYLEHWAPDYLIAVDFLAETESYPLLTLERLNPDYFHRETADIATNLHAQAESPGSNDHVDVVLPRCVVAKVKGDGLALYVNSPADLSLYVDTRSLPLGTAAKITKDASVSLWGPKRASRYELYLRNVKLGLPSLDVSAATFKVGSLSLHNPLMHFSAPLLEVTKPPASIFVVPGHGDLHPGNVLVADTIPTIIDYGKSVTAIPLGADAARFFGGLVRDVLAEELSFEELGMVLFETFGFGSFLKDIETPASRAVALLKHIVEKLIPETVPDLQKTWLTHLYGFAWIGLKWPHGSPESYRGCFLLAAAALQLLLGPTSDELAAATHEETLAPPITTSQPIEPEGPAEILILVSRFSGSADYEPTTRIYSQLSDHIFETVPGLARVERVEEVVSSRKEAVALASRYKASMIVWGTFDNFGISPRYEVTRDSLVMKMSTMQLDQATRHNLSDRFEPYITQNLAAEISFVSLRAVAEMCLLNLNVDAALRVFDRALSLVLDRERARALGVAQVYLAIAAIRFVLNLDKEALEANDKARELEPQDLMAELQSLQIRSRLKKSSFTEYFKQVKEIFRSRLEQGTDTPDQVEAIKTVLAKLEPVHTVADFQKLVESELPKVTPVVSKPGNRQFEKDVTTHLQRAQDLYLVNKYKKALKEIQSALRLNPRCGEAFAVRATILGTIGNIEEALSDLKKAEALKPNHYQIYTARGDILATAKQDYAGALKEYDKAFKSDQLMKSTTLPSWGTAMIELGRGEEAMRLVREWPISPTDENIFVFRSEYYRKRGEYDLALREADHAIQLNEESANARLERAEVLEAQGRREQAIQDLKYVTGRLGELTFVQKLALLRLKELRSLSEADEIEAG
jgi:tetratricopeptide (TPR) repeat protein